MAKIKKGTMCFMSEIGHYNFRYPDKEKSRRFITDSDVNILAYIGGGNFVAIETDVKFLDIDSQNNIHRAVVWVRPKDLI